MPKVTFKHSDGRSRTLDIPAGWTVMEGAVQNSVDGIAAACGGGCACATCHVFVAPEWLDRLPARTAAEEDLLACTAIPRTAQSRLACQLQMTAAFDGLVLCLPERQS